MTDQDVKALRVLVIDDEKFMRQLLVRLLDEIGITDVHTADDGNAAIAMMSHAEAAFDVIVCDLSMPIMGGLEFVTLLRAMENPAAAEVPVIILTGHSQRSNVLAAARLGISSFLVKPVSRQLLETRIRTAVERPRVDPERVSHMTAD